MILMNNTYASHISYHATFLTDTISLSHFWIDDDGAFDKRKNAVIIITHSPTWYLQVRWLADYIAGITPLFPSQHSTTLHYPSPCHTHLIRITFSGLVENYVGLYFLFEKWRQNTARNSRIIEELILAYECRLIISEWLLFIWIFDIKNDSITSDWLRFRHTSKRLLFSSDIYVNETLYDYHRQYIYTNYAPS